MFLGCVSAADTGNTNDVDTTSFSDSCGPIALQETLKTQGINVSRAELAEQAGTDENGTSMQGMINAAQKNGVELYGVEQETSQLQNGDIILLKTNEGYHYTVFTDINSETVTLYNPPQEVSLKDFKEVYTGYTLTTKDNQGQTLNHDELTTIKGSDWVGDAGRAIDGAKIK